MKYLVNQTRVASVQIEGVDYTPNFVSFTCSDGSNFSSGLIATAGSIVLSKLSGGPSMRDFQRISFKRGAEVLISLKKQDGSVVLHPRGRLYVITTSYDTESANTTIELGCRISLSILKDDATTLLPFAPVRLDVAQQTVQGVGASLLAAGKYLYQDNTGALVDGFFFDGDDTEASAPGEWVSVLGRTTAAVSPLAASEPIPDKVVVGYAAPASYEDGSTAVDLTTTESQYFISYPAVMYTRTGNGLGSITGVYEGTVVPATSTGACGNTPAAPGGSQLPPACNEGYVAQQTPLVIAAERVQVQRTEYAGPAGQVSRVLSQTTGPALEANPQYFADSFAYCRYTWATECNPNGSCSTSEGTAATLLQYSETLNYYGSANELVRTVTDTYDTVLSAAQPFNWRSGLVNSSPQDFQTLDPTEMYRSSRVIVDYFAQGTSNIQETTTFTSNASKSIGIANGSIDALDGIRTFERRTSTTISSRPLAPDSTVSPVTRTVSELSTIRMPANRFESPPVESGEYVLRAEAPVPLLGSTEEEVDALSSNYSDFLKKSLLGDFYGLQIGEAMRDEVVDGWRPGMPFRYVDTSENNRVYAMRMDAVSWGITQQESVFATNGIWIGESDGTYSAGSNILGTQEAVSPEAIVGENFVSTGSYETEIDIELQVSSSLTPFVDGIVFVPVDEGFQDTETKTTLTVWVLGYVVEPGSLASLDVNAGMPASNGGDLLLEGAVIVEEDLFE